MIERVISNTALDSFDKRNYNFEDYAKEFAEGEKVTKRPYKDIILFDQGQSVACTRYASVHVSNGQNINEYKANGLEYKQIDPMDVWNRGDKRKYIIMALDQLKKEGLIEGYLEIKKDANMLKNVDKALDMGLYIVTGSDDGLRGNYKAPYIYKRRTDGKIVGHAFPLVDKKNGLYVSPTSFGTDYGDKGYLYIKPEDISSLFTLRAIVDKDETGKFQMFKLKEKIKQFVDLGRTIYENGDTETRQKFITRAISDYFTKRGLYSKS